MVAVTVRFEVQADHVDAFRVAVLQHSKNSLTKEEGCRRFDVCTDPQDESRFFLYEVYDDPAALTVHQQADYFAKFGETVEPWVSDRQISVWRLESPAAA